LATIESSFSAPKERIVLYVSGFAIRRKLHLRKKSRAIPQTLGLRRLAQSAESQQNVTVDKSPSHQLALALSFLAARAAGIHGRLPLAARVSGSGASSKEKKARRSGPVGEG
jgi:hypothetical protein